MKAFFSTQLLAAAALVAGAFAVVPAAHARGDVYFSVGVQPAPGFYGQPEPVYVQPRTVYVAPQPVYMQPRTVYVAPQPVYVAPRPVYTEPRPAYRPGHYGHDGYQDHRGRHDSDGWQRRGPYGDHDGDGIANFHDPDSPRNQRRWARLYGPYGDLDRDGVLNLDDRDRDGDGLRNRHDRFPDDRSRY